MLANTLQTARTDCKEGIFGDYQAGFNQMFTIRQLMENESLTEMFDKKFLRTFGYYISDEISKQADHRLFLIKRQC